MRKDYGLQANDSLTKSIKAVGITTWNQLTSYVKHLPYGRNQNRDDFSLVLSEKVGTCSSKHALLKQVADLNQIPDVRLILAIYKMNGANTPGIERVLEIEAMVYIPEAHCYLEVDGEPLDYTSINAQFAKIEEDLIEEIEITPSQVSTFKVEYHKEFIRNWLVESKSSHGINDIWRIREKCIRALVN